MPSSTLSLPDCMRGLVPLIHHHPSLEAPSATSPEGTPVCNDRLSGLMNVRKRLPATASNRQTHRYHGDGGSCSWRDCTAVATGSLALAGRRSGDRAWAGDADSLGETACCRMWRDCRRRDQSWGAGVRDRRRIDCTAHSWQPLMCGWAKRCIGGTGHRDSGRSSSASGTRSVSAKRGYVRGMSDMEPSKTVGRFVALVEMGTQMASTTCEGRAGAGLLGGTQTVARMHNGTVVPRRSLAGTHCVEPPPPPPLWGPVCQGTISTGLF